MEEKYEYKIYIDREVKDNIQDMERFLNDMGLEGWQVVFASRGVIWFMRRSP